MAVKRTILDEPHFQSLEFLATQALVEGNAAAAFKFADRRCRILPQPEPHCYILRSEASFQMGAKTAALADLENALEIAPDNIAANRRMLAWCDGQKQLDAAFALIRQECHFDSLRKAIRVLRERGHSNFGNFTVLEDTIEGWALWQNDCPLELMISDGACIVREMFQPDLFHSLADCGHATSFSVHRPRSACAQSILLSVAGSVLHSTRTASNIGDSAIRVHWPRPVYVHERPVTVIVPIYGDYDATRLCLDSLLDELNSSHHRAILINDATPDPRIAQYVAELRGEHCVDVLINASNLGFTGSVNRALDQVQQGDVTILNSDTIVPPGFIDRLAAVAQSSSDIGTITPLSNNGEFTSFPIPYTSNSLGSREDVERIDAIAAKFNSHRVIDIPSGIGFCLYVTRACLDNVGKLSDDFGAGYLEDADFCLRARDLGFRNVCAPSVYVGHAGSKSFGSEKRSRVMRNLGILERRYPNHRSECAAFMRADPLRTARQTIELAMPGACMHPRLLVSGAGVIGAIARDRARQLVAKKQLAIILEVQHCADAARVKVINAGGGIPQSLQFNLASSGDCRSLIQFLQSAKPSSIEIFDPANIPLQLIDAMLRLNLPYDIFIADAGLAGSQRAQLTAAAVRFLGPPETGAESGGPDWVNRWRKIGDGAQHILVPCSQAKAFAVSIFPQHAIKQISRPAVKRISYVTRKRPATNCHLGFVPVRPCAHEQWLMCELMRKLSLIRPAVSFTILGKTLDDISLMRSGNVFVTGAVGAEELEYLLVALGVTHLFVSLTRPLFGHPILYAAETSSRPTAYLDWSRNCRRPKKKDLAIDPGFSLDAIIGALSQWISKQ